MIQYKGVNHKTKVHKSGGKTPKWGNEFTLKVGNTSDEMKISVYDEDVTSDDFVRTLLAYLGFRSALQLSRFQL